MAGPLIEVDTITAGITLDVSRQLRLGPDATLELIESSQTGPDGWNIIIELIDNFDRISGDETDRGDSKTIVFAMTSLDSLGNDRDLQIHLRNEGLYIRRPQIGEIYKIDHIDMPADNEAQVYTVYCKTRTMQNQYFD